MMGESCAGDGRSASTPTFSAASIYVAANFYFDFHIHHNLQELLALSDLSPSGVHPRDPPRPLNGQEPRTARGHPANILAPFSRRRSRSRSFLVPCSLLAKISPTVSDLH